MVHPVFRDPVNWALGGLTTFASVIGAGLLDPTGFLLALGSVIIESAGPLFTVTSLFGFTVLPNLSGLQFWPLSFQNIAVGLAVIFAASLLDRVYDNLKEDVL